MNRPYFNFSFLVFFCAFIFSGKVLHAEVSPTPISQIIENTPLKRFVLFRGTVVKSLKLDVLVLADETGEMVVGAEDLSQVFRVGDEVIGYGLYIGSSRYPNYAGEISAYSLALVSNAKDTSAVKKEFAKRQNKGTLFSKSKRKNESPEKEASSPASPTVEERLLRLEDLKKKGLINESEYKTHRDRILSEL